MVELSGKPAEDAEGAESAEAAEAVRAAADESGHAPSPSGVVQALRPAGDLAFRPAGDQGFRPAVEVIGDAAEGVRAAAKVIAAATNARWPMYLRNMKQILRAAAFDERRYGFGGLMDLLRACQKEGLIRMERDRRGGLRVFQGGQLARGGEAAPQVPVEPVVERVAEVVETGQVDAVFEALETEATPEFEDVEPQPATIVDTTAEMLARAAGKGKRPPRAARTAAPKKAARKPVAAAGRRPARSRKNQAVDS
jgi:hypothetical protein